MNDTTSKNFVSPGVTGAAAQQQTHGGGQPFAVQPIAPRALLDTHNRFIDVYAEQARQAAKVQVLPPDTGSTQRGYSTAAELGARNRRFYFTVGALVMVEAIAAWGLVSTANIAALIGDAWTVPLWLSLTGVAALLTVRSVYGSEARLSPESIELARAENQFAVDHMDAETRQLAIKYAARLELERVRLEREQQQLQREANRRLALETQARINDQMQRHTQPQHTMNRLNTYRQPQQQGRQQAAQEAPILALDSAAVGYDLDADMDALQPVYEAEPIEPVADPVRQAVLNFTMGILLAYRNDDQGRKVYEYINPDGQIVNTVVPWSKRGGMTVGQRRQAQELLRQITPWLYEQRNNAWYANVHHYRLVGDAVNAIGNAVTPREGWE